MQKTKTISIPDRSGPRSTNTANSDVNLQGTVGSWTTVEVKGKEVKDKIKEEGNW